MEKKIMPLIIVCVICASIVFMSGCLTTDKGTPPGATGTFPTEKGTPPADRTTGPSGKIVEGKGTVRYLALEGGFYGIMSDDGKEYWPLNIADAFKADGLRVAFTAILKENVTSVYQWGTPIEIITIQKISGPSDTKPTVSTTITQTFIIRGDRVSATGTITYMNLEGGFYGIIGDDGQGFYPVNLGSAFRVKDTKVRFEGVIEKNVTTIYQWGIPLNITKIEKI